MAKGGEIMSDISYLNESDTTEEAIRSRMLAKVTPGVDASEGSYVWDSLSPAAIELVFAAMAIQKALKLGFAQTTSGTYLDYRAAEHGVFRKSATYATGEVTVNGVPGKTVYKGTKFSTEADSYSGISSVYFVATSDTVIGNDGTAIVPINAVTAGAAGNVSAGTILILVESNNAISAVTNTTATTGGCEAESDSDLLKRYLEYVRTPGTSGNIEDYRQWALSVDGVTAVHVLPLWNGPGTVKVVIVGPNKLPANADLVKSVQGYISSDNSGSRKAPIGATVTVVSADNLQINISAKIVKQTSKSISIEEIKEKFISSFTSYLAGIAFESVPVIYARVGGILIDQDGVADYATLTINGSIQNITPSNEQVVTCGEVKIVE